MDFLTAALYTKGDSLAESLTGALLTRFDVENGVRPTVYFAALDNLRSMTGRMGVINPRGFAFDSTETLLSDTVCRHVFCDNTTPYFEDSAWGKPTLSLVDFVLDAVNGDALVVPNYEAFLIDKSIEPIVVAMGAFKVSKSSFNIYAPYLNADGEFRTLSLIDIEDDHAIPFVVWVPNTSADLHEKYAAFLEELPTFNELEIFQDGKLFRVSIPFAPAYCFMGEAFINYLAYNVSYYEMGGTVLDQFLADNRYVPTTQAPTKPAAKRPKKYPAHNVSIQHEYRKPHTREILGCLGQREALSDFVRRYPESSVTLAWIQDIFANKPEGKDWNSDTMCESCLQLKYSCKKNLLVYALELLQQRFYVLTAGMTNGYLPDVLKGGGVSGCSVKSITW